MSSTIYFDFLGTVWANLPEEDKARMGELWFGYEQIFASVFQKFAENHLNVAVQDLQAYSTERWLPYSFTAANFISQPAILTSSQDLSVAVNLTTRYLIRLRIDGFDEREIDCRGLTPGQTTLAEIIQKINQAFGFSFARAIFDGSTLQLVTKTSGVSSKIEVLEASNPDANAAEFILGVDTFPLAVPEYPYVYQSPYPNLAELPELQNAIRDENVTTLLTAGADYVVQDRKKVAFKAEPPASLWARRSLFDEENPWNNFGFLMDIYQANSPRYVDVIQGLWFAFWTGPKPINVKKSLYLLFGLPVAPEPGTVTSVTTTTLELTLDAGEVRSFLIPEGLVAAVAAGDRVDRFDPLVTGIEVLDKINRPGFIRDEIGRAGIGRFLTENASRGTGDTDETKALTLLEEYAFLPQISVEAFITPDINISNVRRFLDAIKPLNKTYLFQVIVGTFRDEIEFLERDQFSTEIDVTSNLDSNETTFLEEADLAAYEVGDFPGLELDPCGVQLQENVLIEVYSFSSLIDSFTA